MTEPDEARPSRGQRIEQSRRTRVVVHEWSWDSPHILGAIAIVVVGFFVLLLLLWGVNRVTHIFGPAGYVGSRPGIDAPDDRTTLAITWPSDMNRACVAQYGAGAYAQLVSSVNPSTPSYWIQCFRDGERLQPGAIDFDRWCAAAYGLDYHSENPLRFAPSSDQPWRSWECELS